MLVRYSPVPRLEDADRLVVEQQVRDLHRDADHHDRVVGQRNRRLVVLAVLNALDLMTTAVLLAIGGGEGNPLLAPVMHLWWAPLVVKAALLTLVLMTLARCPTRSRGSDHMVSLTCVLYVAVVAWNVVLLILRWSGHH